MKIFFAEYRWRVGISIRAAINALMNWRKAERAQIAVRTKNVPPFTLGWDYRPKESVRRHTNFDAARAETAETLSRGPSGVDAKNVVWFRLH
jgi:hypothetical protein